MRDSDLTPAQIAAREELTDLLQRHAAQFGPAFDGDVDEGQVPPDTPVFVDAWVAVVEWTDADGDSYLSRITSKDLRLAHRDGLLHQGMYGFED